MNHVWKQFTDNFYELLSESHLECGYKQFLSGLIFDLQELKPRQYRYTWWGRCTNFSEAFTTHEDFCWNGGDHILSDRENMTLEIESSRFAIRRVAVEDKQMWRDNGRLSNSWHYELCLILPGMLASDSPISVNTVQPQFAYPGPPISGLTLVQQKFLCACVAGMTVCIKWV